MPGEDYDAIMGPVAVPAGCAFEKLPLAVAKGGLTQYAEKAFVEIVQVLVERLARASCEMGRNPLLAPFKLTLVKEAQAGRQEGEDGGSLVHLTRECCGGARLIVILQKASQLVLIIEARVEMLQIARGVA